MNYTKGEWNIENFRHDELGDWRLRAGKQSIMRLVGFQTPQESKANAQLIASAPDLYEALKSLTTHFENCPHLMGVRDGWDEDYIRVANKALTKAEGK